VVLIKLGSGMRWCTKAFQIKSLSQLADDGGVR